MNFKSKLIIAAALSFSMAAEAQSPVSGFMTGKGKGSVVVNYSTESYNEVYLVPTKITGVPVFKDVINTSVNFYGTYGITDKINAVVSLPYIKSKGNADGAVLTDLGFQNERSGIQDLSVFLKFKPYSEKMGNGTLDFVGTVGVTTPLGDYRADEGLQSIIAIGNRSTKITTLGILQYKFNSDYFVTAQAGYSVRNNRVPNAFISELKVGYAGSLVYFDAWAGFQQSAAGTDILQAGFDGFFPATQVNYARVGANVYVPVGAGFGVIGAFNAYLDGRNLGKSTGVSAGLVSNF